MSREAVLVPAFDTLVGRSDVNTAQLTAYGISQAGYWLPGPWPSRVGG